MVPPPSAFEFYEIGVRGLGISTWFSWSQVIHPRPGEKWCAMWEPLQDFAAQRVGRSQAGGFGPLGSAALDLEEYHRVYMTAHSPRPHPGSSHPPTGSSGLGPQGLRYQTPPPTARLRTGESELPPISCPFPTRSCIIACCEGLSAAGKSSRCRTQCCAATRENGPMGGALLGPLPERGNFCKRRRGEGSSPTQNNRLSGVEAWCLACLSRLSVRGKGRAKQRRQQFCCSQRVQDPSCLRATSTAPGDPGANVRPFSLLGSPHCRLESVRDDVNAGQEREHGQQ